MRSFRFAVPLSLYLVINGWMYMKYPAEYLIISLVLTLPLLFVAISGLRSAAAAEQMPGGESPPIVSPPAPDILSESLVPYIAALALCLIFGICIYKFTQPGVFFIMPNIGGWTWLQGLTLVVVGIGMAASGLAIWSGQFVFRIGGKEQLRRTFSFHLFKMGLTPNARLIYYFAILFMVWAIGYGATAALYAHKRGWSGLIIVTGRCVLPLCLTLIGAMLRLPAAPFLAVGILASGALFGYSTSWTEGIVFTGAQIVALSVYAAIVEKKSRPIRKQPVMDKIREIQVNKEISGDNPE